MRLASVSFMTIKENKKVIDANRSVRLSLVIPIFAQNSMLERTLKSVRDQVNPFDQIVVVDDNPKVSNRENFIGELLGDEVDYIYIKNAVNLGSAGSLNAGVKASKHNTIVLFNDDDLIENTRALKIRNYTLPNISDLYWGFSSVECIDVAGNKIESQNLPRFLYDAISANEQHENLVGVLKYTNPIISSGNLFFSKTIWEIVGGFNENLTHVHDWEFATKLAIVAKPIYLKNEKYLYRIHPNNSFRAIAKRDSDSQVNQLRQNCEQFLWEFGSPDSVYAYFPELISGAGDATSTSNHYVELGIPEIRVLNLFKSLLKVARRNRMVFRVSKYVFGRIELLLRRT
jgi:glycosyltransferase involved in cell wall biosynthesis